ncbi:MAG: hypothetical protein MUF49_17540 [Oculatellaceae cyanobacterium Prado106]|nr:hypothetical protein [Oculatellaceae cyanobacterium Prado106]
MSRNNRVIYVDQCLWVSGVTLYAYPDVMAIANPIEPPPFQKPQPSPNLHPDSP